MAAVSDDLQEVPQSSVSKRHGFIGIYGLEPCVEEERHLKPCPVANCPKGVKLPRDDALVERLIGSLPVLRQPGLEVGLVNHGATCYLNSLLQVLFHNEKFRQLTFEWQGKDEICSELQALFARMQGSVEQTVSPAALIRALGVEPGVQQDAAEFWKFLISALRERWGSEAIAADLVREFRCSMLFLTRCNHCKSVSKRAEDFLGLPLTICDTLEESIRHAILPESLDGENQYDCATCGSKQDATRTAVLSGRHLPNTLIFELLRFVYDPKRQARMKLSSKIGFPLVLDMSQFCEDGHGGIYELVGVVLHLGADAHFGHYVAHLRGRTGAWHCAEDSSVSPIGDYAQADERGHSSDAYMLIYRRQGSKPNGKGAVVPPPLAARVRSLNEVAQRQIESASRQLTEIEGHIADWRRVTRAVLNNMCADPSSEDFYFVDGIWWEAWTAGWFVLPSQKIVRTPEDTLLLSAKGNAVIVPRCIPNNELLCEHGNVSPSRRPFKVVNHVAWKILSKVYGGSSYSDKALCRQCVDNRKEELEAESASRLRWHELANQLNSTTTREIEAAGSGFFCSRSWIGEWAKPEPDEAALRLSDPLEHVLCKHGLLSTQEPLRRLIPADVWSFAREQFHIQRDIPSDTQECPECRLSAVQTSVNAHEMRERKVRDRRVLRDLWDWEPEQSTQFVNAHSAVALAATDKKLRGAHTKAGELWRAECKRIQRAHREAEKEKNGSKQHVSVCFLFPPRTVAFRVTQDFHQISLHRRCLHLLRILCRTPASAFSYHLNGAIDGRDGLATSQGLWVLRILGFAIHQRCCARNTGSWFHHCRGTCLIKKS
eukprot:NODE_90_length_3349_cov_18.454242_g81_i0.p1 GENE.NODE_90_length_3349_cov_18.454242_g81_i0~~NODE_90_length_3349_cov_18.454242_g81_i0.p1  ORF type:complete len:829 (-),score=117.48 NODE_90_length_3349_cov_18.454242_g81_i0:806-3292(-)